MKRLTYTAIIIFTLLTASISLAKPPAHNFAPETTAARKFTESISREMFRRIDATIRKAYPGLELGPFWKATVYGLVKEAKFHDDDFVIVLSWDGILYAAQRCDNYYIATPRKLADLDAL